MKIFISYAHVDEDAVREIADILSDFGHEPWFDHRLVVGRSWQDQLLDAIQACDRFLYALTPESFASAWCQWEFAQAVHAGKPVVPILLKGMGLPGVLSRVQFADFSNGLDARMTARLLRGVIEAETLNPDDVPLSPIPNDEDPERPVVQANGTKSLVERLLENAYAAFRVKAWTETHELLTDCLRLDPDHAEARQLLEMVELRQGEWRSERALAAVRRVLEVIPLPFEWIDIPAGRIEMESGHGSSDVVAFAVAKYPITNAQFQVFLGANNGWRDPQWWAFSGHARRWHSDTPILIDAGFQGDTLPRTNVSWYSAVAFCRWLSDKTGDLITLPTEWQWQRAAQGDDGREYPWGGAEPDKHLCNFNHNVGNPTPVMQYPDGASPYGVIDMVGNVWEWCLNTYNNPRQDHLAGDASRVLRGGAWINSPHDIRCTYRYRHNPSDWSERFGFRIVRLNP